MVCGAHCHLHFRGANVRVSGFQARLERIQRPHEIGALALGAHSGQCQHVGGQLLTDGRPPLIIPHFCISFGRGAVKSVVGERPSPVSG